MGILLEAPFGFGDANLPQQLKRPLFRGGLGQPFMQPQSFGQLATNGKDRVKGRHRLLKNHPDLVAADGAHQVLVGLGQINIVAVPAVKQQSAARNPPAPELNQTHQRQRRDRLARPGLTHHADRFAGIDGKGYILDPQYRPVLSLKFNTQALNFRNWAIAKLIEHQVLRNSATSRYG